MDPNLPPGPWRMEAAPKPSVGAFQIDGRPVFDIYDRDGQWIARAAADTKDQAEAIAVLILAGPDLLRTAREIVSQCDQGGSTGKVFGRDNCIEQARAAVIKATATRGGG